MNKKDLGLFIKERRQILNISQLDLANLLNITTQAISRWENGLSYPNFILLGELAKILKLSLNDLLTLNNSSKSIINNETFNQSTFGPNINKYLKDLKLTQLDLENKLNIPQTSISNIINGKAFPSLTQFIDLCELFNISYEDLYYSKYQKKIKKQRKITPYIISFLSCLIIIFISISLINNNSINNTKEYYPIIEFYDSNNNLLSSKKYKHNSKVNPPSYFPILGYNKEIIDASYSTIYKENKNPYDLTLRVIYENNIAQYYHFDTYEDFNIYKIQHEGNYCYKLTHTNNEIFDINKINKNYYEVKAYTKPNRTHSITFSSLDLNPLTTKTGTKLYDLPYIFNEEYIVKEYTYNNKIVKRNDIYSFEESIDLSPVKLNQKTLVNSDGYITYLSSDEEEIVIPSSINNITIKGIASNSIHLNNNNKKITFLNDSPISFKDVFYNKSLINNIKEIYIESINIRKESYLGNIEHLDKVTVGYNHNNQIIDRYYLKTISSNKDFKIDILEYYSDAYFGCSFHFLNVDNVYCLDESISNIYAGMFRYSSLKRINFKGNILANSNDFVIEKDAFSNCTNLEYFEFPNNTHVTGTSQFYNCTSLKNVDFYGKINALTNYMFYNTPLKNITCNYEIDTIYNSALVNTNIENIEITSLNNIEDYIYFPTSLKNLYVGSKHTKPFIIREHNDVCIHYLDHSIYEDVKATYKTCVNCTHLHSLKDS